MKSDEDYDLEDIDVDEPEGQETSEILQGLAQTFDPSTFGGSFGWPEFVPTGKSAETSVKSAFQSVGQDKSKVKVVQKKSYENFSDSEESGDEKEDKQVPILSGDLLDDHGFVEGFRTRNWVDAMNEEMCYECAEPHEKGEECRFKCLIC